MRKEKKSKKLGPSWPKALGIAGAAAVPFISREALGHVTLKELTKPNIYDVDLDNLVKSISPTSKLTKSEEGFIPFAHFGKNTIFTPERYASPITIAHEAGHLSEKGRLPLPITGISAVGSRFSPLLSMGVIPFAGSTLAKPVGYGLGALAFGLNAPGLYEEGRASVLGGKALYDRGVPAWDAIKALGPAFGTYLAHTALATGLPIALGEYFAHKAKKRKERLKKTSSFHESFFDELDKIVGAYK